MVAKLDAAYLSSNWAYAELRLITFKLGQLRLGCIPTQPSPRSAWQQKL